MRILVLLFPVLAAGVAVLGCRAGAKPNADAGPPSDASTLDVFLPETVEIVLEAGVDPGHAPGAPARRVELMSGLPRPCQDRVLGTVTFSQNGDDVVITSSKTKARATCSRKDDHTLVCDWVGLDGRAGFTQKPVTYGLNRPIGGAIDKTHALRCPAQR